MSISVQELPEGVRHPGSGGGITAGLGCRPAAARRTREGWHAAPANRDTPRYSHSIVPGGLLVMSTATRLIAGTSLVIRVEIASSTS